jgi:hypothetical protein
MYSYSLGAPLWFMVARLGLWWLSRNQLSSLSNSEGPCQPAIGFRTKVHNETSARH